MSGEVPSDQMTDKMQLTADDQARGDAMRMEAYPQQSDISWGETTVQPSEIDAIVMESPYPKE